MHAIASPELLENRKDLWPETTVAEVTPSFTERDELTARYILHAVHTSIQQDTRLAERAPILRSAIARQSGGEIIAISALLENEMAADTVFGILSEEVIQDKQSTAQDSESFEDIREFDEALIVISETASRKYDKNAPRSAVPLPYQRVNHALQQTISQLYAFLRIPSQSDFLDSMRANLRDLPARELSAIPELVLDLPHPYRSMIISMAYITAKDQARTVKRQGDSDQSSAYESVAAIINTYRSKGLQKISAQH